MDLGLNRRQLFVMFGAVYFVQGVIQAYQLNFFKPHMDSAGIDADRLAIVASLALVPFIIKWVFGLVSDRFPLFGESFPVLAVILAATFLMALFDTVGLVLVSLGFGFLADAFGYQHIFLVIAGLLLLHSCWSSPGRSFRASTGL